MPRITIIETGVVSPANRARHGTFPQMFERLLGEADPSASFTTIRLADGEALPDPARWKPFCSRDRRPASMTISTGSRRSSASYARRMTRERQWPAYASAIN